MQNSVIASAPSNIALIKYMGKVDTVYNRPTNISLSYTLEHLRTTVQLTATAETTVATAATTDIWQPLSGPDFFAFTMTEKGQEKFKRHFQFLKKHFGYEGSVRIKSANNFPADAGIASSASSFAALTLAAQKFFLKHNPSAADLNLEKLSELSRLGSGSSCRSFFAPWAMWKKDQAEKLNLPEKYNQLLHLVIVPETTPKKISSSQAHQLVTTSRLFPGRPERAEARYQQLVQAFQDHNWKRAYQITWDEFMDMHEMFRACPEPFDYRTKGSLQILKQLQEIWSSQNDGPLVTMDAGSSVHLLFRADQKPLAETLKKDFQSQFQVWGQL